MREAIAGRLVGSPVQRVEDPRWLLRAAGHYTSTILTVRVWPTPRFCVAHTHTRIVSIDVARHGRCQACARV